MDDQADNRRREPRYPVRAEAFVQRATGDRIPASTINISGGGVLLNLEDAAEFELGESVTCGVNLDSQKPPQSWGTGRVVRIENSLIAVDFRCDTAEDPEPAG